MKWVDNGGGDFENPEPGSYAARCYKITDIGTQTGEYQGKQTIRRQVIIGWELDEKMTDGRPFVVSKFYTASLNEKATLRHDLEGWRGRQFTDEELGGFDPKKLIAQPCLLSLTKTDKGKIKVASVGKLPKSMTAPEIHNPTVFFSLDDFDPGIFDGLSDGIKKLVMQSPEYQEARNPRNMDEGNRAAAMASADAEDCPF